MTYTVPETDRSRLGQAESSKYANLGVDLARDRQGQEGAAGDPTHQRRDQLTLAKYGFPHLDPREITDPRVRLAGPLPRPDSSNDSEPDAQIYTPPTTLFNHGPAINRPAVPETKLEAPKAKPTEPIPKPVEQIPKPQPKIPTVVPPIGEPSPTISPLKEKPKIPDRIEPEVPRVVNPPRVESPVVPSDRISTTDETRELPRTANMPGAAVFIPHGFDKDKPAQLVMLYHGFGTTGEEFLHDLQGKLKDVNSGSDKRNMLFVSVDWQRNEGGSGRSLDSSLQRGGWVANTMKAALATKGMTLADVGRSGIVSWSAGYDPTFQQLQDLRGNNRGIYNSVKDIALFDSHFFAGGAVDQWLNDNKKNPDMTYLDIVNPGTTGGGHTFFVADRASMQAQRLRNEDRLNVYYDRDASKPLTSEELSRHRIAYKATNIGHYQIPVSFVQLAVKNMHEHPQD